MLAEHDRVDACNSSYLGFLFAFSANLRVFAGARSGVYLHGQTARKLEGETQPIVRRHTSSANSRNLLRP